MRLSILVAVLGAAFAKRTPSIHDDDVSDAPVLMQTQTTLTQKVPDVGQEVPLEAYGFAETAVKPGIGLTLAVFALEIVLGALVAKGLLRARGWMNDPKKGLKVVVATEQSEALDKVPEAATHRTAMAPMAAALLAAARAGDVVKVAELLGQGATSDASDDWGCTALHAAAYAGHVPVAQLLLQSGARADMREAWDETPLHFAARGGHVELLELLVEHGAPVDDMNADDRTPLVMAAVAGHEAACQALLDRGAGAGGLPDDEVPPLLAILLARDCMRAVLGLGGSEAREDR